jgi:hypothetical protein
MRIEGHHTTWHANDARSLAEILRRRDSKGGGQFWISAMDDRFPCLALRVSGDLADVHYFPEEGHPGFRCLAEQDLLDERDAIPFVYCGCDPASGEEVPREFVVPFMVALAVATEFLSTRQLPEAARWLEL